VWNRFKCYLPPQQSNRDAAYAEERSAGYPLAIALAIAASRLPLAARWPRRWPGMAGAGGDDGGMLPQESV